MMKAWMRGLRCNTGTVTGKVTGRGNASALRWGQIRGGVRFFKVHGRGLAMAIESFTEESDMHKSIRENVRELCKRYPNSYWRDMDRERQYPTQFVQELTKSGFLSCLIPEEYGGSGLGLREACIILEEIHRSGGNGGAAHAQMYTMGTLLKHGSEEQKREFLPKIASGELRLQAFGVSEPGSGTDTLSLETSAVRDGDSYIIKGQKIWTSRAEHSDMMLLLARTGGEHTPRRNRLSTFLVDMKEAKKSGMTIRPIETMINHSTCEVFFDEVRIPASALIGEEGNGFSYILSSMNAERILIASECIGDARFFIDRATSYAKERVVFSKPIGQNQGIQFPIAEAFAQTEAADLMVQAAASMFQHGLDCGPQANMAKHLASEASWKAGDTCMQTHGGFAFACEYDIERKWREARLYRIAPISSNLILSYLSEKVLRMPRSF